MAGLSALSLWAFPSPGWPWPPFISSVALGLFTLEALGAEVSVPAQRLVSWVGEGLCLRTHRQRAGLELKGSERTKGRDFAKTHSKPTKAWPDSEGRVGWWEGKRRTVYGGTRKDAGQAGLCKQARFFLLASPRPQRALEQTGEEAQRLRGNLAVPQGKVRL